MATKSTKSSTSSRNSNNSRSGNRTGSRSSQSSSSNRNGSKANRTNAGATSRSRIDDSNYYDRSYANTGRGASYGTTNRAERRDDEGIFSRISHMFEGDEDYGNGRRRRSTNSTRSSKAASSNGRRRRSTVGSRSSENGRRTRPSSRYSDYDYDNDRNGGVLESISAWFGDEDYGNGRRRRSTRDTTSAGNGRRRRNSTAASTRSTASKRKTATRARGGADADRPMTPAEAGRLGGLAPHRCRGQECNTQEYRRSQRSRSTSSSRRRSS